MIHCRATDRRKGDRPNFHQVHERQNCAVNMHPFYHLRTILSLNPALANIFFSFALQMLKPVFLYCSGVAFKLNALWFTKGGKINSKSI